MQARIQSKILENLSKVAKLARIPEDSFERFAMGRYESRLQEAVENGLIQQEELKQYTEEETVRNYIAANRATLEKEFTVLLVVDDIFQREGLQADQDAVNEQLESRSEQFKQSGKIVTVRLHMLCYTDITQCMWSGLRCSLQRWSVCIRTTVSELAECCLRRLPLVTAVLV